MKKLAILLIVVIALVGCGKESEQIDANATRAKDDVQTLTIAWHKVTEADGSICALSTSTEQTVEQASKELSKALAANGVEVVVETLTPEKVEGSECVYNRVLIQGRFVDEWLGAELARTPCSGCPNQTACPNSAGSGGACGGQTAMIHQGKKYDIVPANLIIMAGMIAAADLTGEPITYGGCPGPGACNGQCTCGQCEGGCRFQAADASAAVCGSGCPGKTATCGMACQRNPGSCTGTCAKTAAAESKQTGCPQASQCKGKACPLAGN